MAEISKKLYRLVSVYKHIKRNAYISLPDLVDCVQEDMRNNEYNDGISKRSIQRDISEISTSWISIHFDRWKKGYYIPDDEVVAPLVEKMLEQICLVSSFKMIQNISDYVIPEQRKTTGINNLSLLILALKNQQIVEFDYLKYANMSVTHRTVEPYRLRQFNGRWYVLANEAKDDNMKIWALERIENLTITNRRFKQTRQSDVQRLNNDSFGIYTSTDLPLEEIILSFTPKSGKYILSRPLHHSQVVLICDECEVRIRLNIKLTNDFIMELLSQTDKMTIISPQHLKDYFRSIYLQAINRMDDPDMYNLIEDTV